MWKGVNMNTVKQGTVLKEYRRKAKVTQKDMAKQCGISKNHISAIERGLHNCNASVLLQYIKICKIPVDMLF